MKGGLIETGGLSETGKLIEFSKEGGIISPERTRMQVGKAQAQEVKGHAAEV